MNWEERDSIHVHVCAKAASYMMSVESSVGLMRTSFMIDEMKKLQSNKTKAAARNKDVAEMRTQIRKRIGTLSGSREVQPLSVGLREIQNADRHGKW